LHHQDQGQRIACRVGGKKDGKRKTKEDLKTDSNKVYNGGLGNWSDYIRRI